MKSLAKDPDERFQTTEAMLEAIIDFEEKFPVVALADEILSGPPQKKKNKTKINDDDGPDTRFEKALKNQRRDFIKRYGLLFSILLITILVFIAYLFSSKSNNPANKELKTAEISINSKPENVLVYIDDDSIGTLPLNNFSLSAGSHKITLQKKDYETLDTLITVTSKADYSFDLRPILKKTSLTKIIKKNSAPKQTDREKYIKTSLFATSDPKGATIWIDGIRMGKTPMQVDQIDTKPHKIRIELEGYSPYLNSIELENGTTTRINAELTRIGGGLQINTTPENAIIKIDGEEINNIKTPATLTGLSLGQHQIQISKAGYSPITKRTEIKKDQITSLSVELIRLEGKLNVQVRPWGSIYINNELQKASSDIKYQIDLPVEEYTLQVVHPTLGRWIKKINIEANNELKVVVDFNRKHQVEFIAVDESGIPVEAQIFLDDKNMEKTTPTSLKIRTGIHDVMLKKAGFIASNGKSEIFVDKDLPGSFKFVLRKID